MSWFPQDLIAKAKHFSHLALLQSDTAHSSLLNSFAVELLCRACLANISPYLLTSSNDRLRGAVYIKSGSGSARSLDSSDVIKQCETLIPSFANVASYVKSIADARNADLHSAESPWTKTGSQRLRVLSYVVIGACLEILSVDVDDFFGLQADIAREYIEDFNKSVQTVWDSRLYEARGVYKRLSIEEFETRIGLMAVSPYEKPEVARRACPACSQTGVMTFKVRMFATNFEPETGCVTQELHRTPISFQCQICDLKVGSSLLCEVGMSEVEVFELTSSAIDALTREQALEQIPERFESTEFLSDEERELLMEGMHSREYYDDLDYNARHNK